MANKLHTLDVVDEPHPNAAKLEPTTTPVIRGNENEDSACGKCGVILLRGVSFKTIIERFATPTKMVIKCPECAAYNRLPAQMGNG